MMILKPKVLKRGGKQRSGKGFSRGELSKAGLSLREALKLKIPVDSRRRTVHEENVEIVKSLLGTSKAASKIKKVRRREVK